jgi:hypothetical protein
VVEGGEGSPSSSGGTQWSVLGCLAEKGHVFPDTESVPISDSPEDTFWDSYFDAALGPYDRPFETLLEEHDFQTAYGMSPGGGKTGPVKGVPKNAEGRKPQYLCKEEGAEGQSRWSHRWWLSTAWEYWQPGCLSTSTDRFRKYFRIGRDLFEDIYSNAARSGEFAMHPLEPMYGELHPGGPIRHGCAQVKKVSPLCLKMAASLRCLATGLSFGSLAEEFLIGESTLNTVRVLR